MAKAIDAPGSIPFFVLCLAIGLLLRFVWPRRRGVARTWLALLIGAYLLLALPWVARTLEAQLPAVDSSYLWNGEPIQTLIVFDGDNRRGRVERARQMYDLRKPGEVWLLGNAWMWDAMWRSGIPYDLIHHTDTTPTTRAQIGWTLEYVAKHPSTSVALVASRLQVPRIVALLRAANLDVPVVTAPVDDEPPAHGLWQLVPTYLALRISRDTLYEHAALWHYRRQGWID